MWRGFLGAINRQCAYKIILCLLLKEVKNSYNYSAFAVLLKINNLKMYRKKIENIPNKVK